MSNHDESPKKAKATGVESFGIREKREEEEGAQAVEVIVHTKIMF